VLQQGDLPEAAAPAASFDAVVLDRVLATHPRRDELLRESTRVLRPGGKLIVVEAYEALCERADGGNPLAALRGWIAGGGLKCERLRPVDTGATHAVLATASAESAERAA
jgi:ubiquinone/menaquinone biosynthesis C-methylase UbiE